MGEAEEGLDGHKLRNILGITEVKAGVGVGVGAMRGKEESIIQVNKLQKMGEIFLKVTRMKNHQMNHKIIS